ncbi:hypothetical protein DICPUDRAFT_33594 [Dictyostelium purpureum]|uniref:Uncharacterized protein n=1 Tax=Dictyostelium purpureum TaxID=5786 RepID=F0ZL57_DICPU|nr:uncharacterized protein DICPUDRAFT_33594 [Dictyostelium purpureum]EGC35335.1 hypothetical protein DICPUDRAFT_33594 [Dictyostelium purpureum]|eukprot:XP_003288142.1 hypothetical protein DICPUDRAFT_33594 [Dictyostelium purpureum]
MINHNNKINCNNKNNIYISLLLIFFIIINCINGSSVIKDEENNFIINSDDSSSGDDINFCDQLDSDFFVQIINQGFEDQTNYSTGWQATNETMFINSEDCYEGTVCLMFSESTESITSVALQFPNFMEPRVTDLFPTFNLSFYYLYTFESSSSESGSLSSESYYTTSESLLTGHTSTTGTSGGSSIETTGSGSLSTGSQDKPGFSNQKHFKYSKLDLMNIENNNNNNNNINNNIDKYNYNFNFNENSNENLIPNYLSVYIDNNLVLNISTTDYSQSPTPYQKATVDITKFCDGGQHEITLKYTDTGYFIKLNIFQTIIVDYINFAPIPSQLIDNDIYVSNNGSDFSGNGTLANTFCSIQRAIYSIQDGRNIYLLGINYIEKFYWNQTYYVDFNGKSLGLKPTDQNATIYTNDFQNQIFLVNSPLVTLSNINMVQRLPSRAFSVCQNSSLQILNCNFQLERTTQYYLVPAFQISILSNFSLVDSYINGCYTYCIVSLGINTTIQGVYFDDVVSSLITIDQFQSSLYFSNSKVLSTHPNDFQLVVSTAFKVIEIDSIDFFSNLSSTGNVPTMTVGGGYSFSISNISATYQALSIMIIEVEHILIKDFTIYLYTYFQNEFLNVEDSKNLVIRDMIFYGSQDDSHPYIQANRTENLLMDNITYTFNPTTLVYANQVYNFTLTNSIFSNNSNLVSLLVSNANTYIYNTIMEWNNIQFLSISKSKLEISNVSFIGNQNFDTSTNMPLIYMVDMEPSSIRYLNVSDGFNFEIIKIINSENVLLSSSVFSGQQLGNIIGIQFSKLHIIKSKFINNFLGQSYPIHSINSQLELERCYFFNNTQYFFMSNTTFQINNTDFDNIITVSQKSYYIYKSTGIFKRVTTSNTNPHIGIVIDLSNVKHYNCNFNKISSYNNTLGLYTNSNLLFSNCTFDSNTAAFNMATFIKNITVFDNCTFYYQASIEVSLFSSVDQNLLLLNNSKVQTCQSKSDGIQIRNSNFIMENTNFTFNFIQGGLVNMFASKASFFNINFIDNSGNIMVANSNLNIENFTGGLNSLSNPLFDITGSNSNILNSLFQDNSCSEALFELTNSNLNITGSSFFGNILTNGSVIETTGSSLNMQNSTCIENSNERGGSCFSIFNNVGTDTFIDSKFSNNTAQYGAVGFLNSASLEFSGCSFFLNTISFVGLGEVGLQGSGGVFTLQENSSVVASNSSFNLNSASNFGGVAFLYGQGNIMFFKNSYVYSNTVEFGAGGVCYSTVYEGCFTDSQTKFLLNSAIYGDNFASFPAKLKIQSQSFSIHPNTNFTLGITLFDYYNQSMTFLDFQVSYIVNITINNIVVQSFSTQVYQGSILLPGLAFNHSIGQIVRFSALAWFPETDGDQVILTDAFEIPFTGCSIGFSPNSSNYCLPCQIGTYGYDGSNCYSCDPTKVICPGKDVMYPQQGYWILLEQDKKPDIFACDPAYCQNRQCRTGQGGVLCSVCEPGYSKVKMYCEKCEGFNVYLLLGMILFYIILVLFLSIFTVPSTSIILNYLLVVQIIAVMGYNIQYLSIIPLFTFSLDYWPSACLDPTVTFLWKQVISYCIIFLIVIPISTKFTWGKKLMARILPRFNVFITEIFDKNLVYSLISMLVTLYTPITYISLSLVSCTKIGSSSYLSLDPSVECFTSKHLPLFIFACIILVLVTIGVPLYIFIQIRRKNRYFTKIFFEKYRSNFIWWDILLMVRSVLYIIVTFAFAFSYIDIKGLVISTMGLFFTFVTWMCKPYRSQYKNELESYLSLVITLVGLIINTRALTSIDVFSGVILSLSGVIALVPIGICIGHINQKIYNKGIQTTNPSTTKVKTRQNKVLVKSINDGEDEFDPLINKHGEIN